MIDIPFIRIDKDVFDNAEYDELVLLLGLLHFDPEKKGVFKAKLYVNADLTKSINYNKLSPTYKELLGMYFEEAILTNSKYRIVSNQNQPKNQFTLLEAIRFFQTPISIVLENSLNDGYFMKAIFKHFDKSGILMTYYNYGWIQFDNAGGWTNMYNFLEEKIQQLNKFTFKTNATPIKFLRNFVLIDSDRGNQNAELGNDKKKLLLYFNSINIEAHILNKRSMENYLPDKAVLQLNKFNYQLDDRGEREKMINWKSNGAKQTWIDEYIGLQKEEKDYKDFSELDMPFDKREMPKFFGYNNFTDKQGLLTREGGTENKNEFLEIITKIGSLL